MAGLLYAFDAFAGIGCTVNGSVSGDTEVSKLVICRYDEDPKDATIIPIISDGKFKCTIEDKEISM